MRTTAIEAHEQGKSTSWVVIGLTCCGSTTSDKLSCNYVVG